MVDFIVIIRPLSSSQTPGLALCHSLEISRQLPSKISVARAHGPSPDLLDALAARIESPEALISWTELGRAMAFVVVIVVRTAWWAALKFALCNVLAYGAYRVLGYVLSFLRFFSQIPW